MFGWFSSIFCFQTFSQSLHVLSGVIDPAARVAPLIGADHAAADPGEAVDVHAWSELRM